MHGSIHLESVVKLIKVRTPQPQKLAPAKAAPRREKYQGAKAGRDGIR
jgi:hypothetical protein